MENTTPSLNGQPTPGTQGEPTVISGGNNPIAPTPITNVDPGSKTDSALLLKSLQDERDKVRRLEEELSKRPPTPSDEIFSEEGNLLKQQISDLNSKIGVMEEDNVKKELLSVNPVLKDKWPEFIEFRLLPENKGMSIRTAAKAFLIEKGLVDSPRIGLETPTGGPRTPSSNGEMTTEDVKHLRETNFRKYQELLMKGQIKV